jgi:hypothetical protein
MLCVLNLGGKQLRDYVVQLGSARRARLLLNTDWERFSGNSLEDDCRWFKLANDQITCTLPPFSGQLFLLE